MDELISKPYNFDLCMLEMAERASRLSKDSSVQIGAMIVRPDGSPVSWGYNGFPRDIPDKAKWWNNRDNFDDFTKYELVLHAERNAMDQANEDLEGCILYTTCHPCLDCALAIVRNKLKKVVYNSDNDTVMDLKRSKVKRMFDIASIQIVGISVKEEKTYNIISKEATIYPQKDRP